MPLHRVLLLVLLAEATVALGLLVYMAVADKSLIVEITAREGLRSPGASGRLIVPVAGVHPAELRDTYGHLKRFRAGVKEGDLVRQGDVVAYVGQTGNAGTPHLHFSVSTVTDPNRWWQGRPVSPRDLLPCGVPEEDSG